MLAKVLSSAVIGIDAFQIDVEVDISKGLPSFTIVGLPEVAVRESKERVKAAIRNAGYRFPDDRITVNLAPAHVKKDGTGFDLPIALGILCACGVIEQVSLDPLFFWGELSLDARIKPVMGTLPMAMAAKERACRGIAIPAANGTEASAVRDLAIYAIDNLSQIVEFLRGQIDVEPVRSDFGALFKNTKATDDDYSEVKGQEQAKRALEIAAAGNHNLLMVGPPGSGKTMLARRLPSILPELTMDEAIEVTKIHSVAGKLMPCQALVAQRTFRSPHHTVSDAGLIGGGKTPRPGEVSLAHNGVLFLDELSEYKRHVLEVMRQPLEDGKVTLSRANASITYPAAFMLVAAMNPCPCGYHTDSKRVCRCTGGQIQRYKARISGPLLDRIDLHVHVPALPVQDLTGFTEAETSEQIRKRVISARRIQQRRFQRFKVRTNAQMAGRHLRLFCALTPDLKKVLECAVDKFGLSARAYHRVLKLARTIADLDEEECLGMRHLTEAIQYRSMDTITTSY